MSLRSPTDNAKSDAVMPAWIAGIQARKDASETSHVNLMPALHGWNDAVEHLLNSTEDTRLVFKEDHCWNFQIRIQRL